MYGNHGMSREQIDEKRKVLMQKAHTLRKQGLSNKQVGARLGVHAGTVSAWYREMEKGDR